MKKEILKQLKSDYEKLEIKPSADLWGRIEQIDQREEKSADISFKKAFQRWKYAAVLVLLVSVGVLLYFNRNHPANTDNPIVHTELPKKDIKTPLTGQKIDAAQNIITENNTSQEKLKVIPDIPRVYQQKETLQKEGLSMGKEEQIIVADYEIKAPVLDKNIIPIADKPALVENKKTEYINADELLQGREFQKKREENRTDIRKFGALDMTKIKVKSPNSLKIFGVTVYTDSLESK
ncbi:hypothetical protein KYG33_04805 [Chryseobacterium sp. D764]|uniref:hypothetical protein n=1 Tax=unclassified Chryseobacterium TaxID=2593645 RepID=UPI0009844E97|nr:MULTISPECIES: hypothetical protein [unclassified Chryseobacterium]QXU50365.1 hypothetical protein KYG33_04805 [Chryseobacterium sp. D764]CAD0218834.1 conserved protein of unknown function [Chryseobacterium sp. JV274]